MSLFGGKGRKDEGTPGKPRESTAPSPTRGEPETDRERITCTCPGYRKRGHCKHAIAYVAASRYASLGAIKAIEKARGWFYGC